MSARFVALLCAAAVIGAPAAGQTSRLGEYDGGQTEMATRLQLTADGRFRYMLSYGALDEGAEGNWIERDGAVRLTTDPRPTPPRFVLISDTPAPAGELSVALDKPEFLQGSSLTLALTYADDSRPLFVEADEAGRVPIEAGRTPVSIVPDLPVFTIPFAPYALSPGGHRLVFKFESNDLGIADFRGEPLRIDGDVLVLERYQRTIRFRRADPVSVEKSLEP